MPFKRQARGWLSRPPAKARRVHSHHDDEVTQQLSSQSHSQAPVPRGSLGLREDIASTPIPQLPDPATEALLKLREPDRLARWLKMCFLFDASGEVAQFLVWKAYRSAVAPHRNTSAKDFLRNIIDTFHGARIERSGREYVIKGMRPRLAPAIDVLGTDPHAVELVTPAIAPPNEMPVPMAPLPPPTVEGLRKLEEPRRWSVWLRMRYIVDAGSEVMQVKLWQDYQSIRTQLEAGGVAMLPIAFFNLVTDTFAGSQNRVEGAGKYVVKGIKPREVPLYTIPLARPPLTDTRPTTSIERPQSIESAIEAARYRARWPGKDSRLRDPVPHLNAKEASLEESGRADVLTRDAEASVAIQRRQDNNKWPATRAPLPTSLQAKQTPYSPYALHVPPSSSNQPKATERPQPLAPPLASHPYAYTPPAGLPIPPRVPLDHLKSSSGVYRPRNKHKNHPDSGVGANFHSVPYPLSLLPFKSWEALHNENLKSVVCSGCSQPRSVTPHQRKLFLVAERLGWQNEAVSSANRSKNEEALWAVNAELEIYDPAVEDERVVVGGRQGKTNAWYPFETERDAELVMRVVERAEILSDRSWTMWKDLFLEALHDDLEESAVDGSAGSSCSVRGRPPLGEISNNTNCLAATDYAVYTNGKERAGAKTSSSVLSSALPTPPSSAVANTPEQLAPASESNVKSLQDFYTLLDRLERTSPMAARFLEAYAELLRDEICKACWLKHNILDEEELESKQR